MATTTEFFSTPQWIAIVWTPRFSGLLSIIGSVMVITMILRGGKEKREKIHNRLLLGLSVVDIINSSGLGVSTAAFPRAVGHIIYGAYGNQTSCTTQGVFIAIGTSGPLYNAALCVHYLCVIKYNISDDVLRKYEKYMHGIPLGFASFLTIFALSTGIIHPTVKANCWVANGCELADYPDASSSNSTGSDSSTCTPRPEFLVKFGRFFATSFGILGIIVIIFCMVSIYLSVRNQSQTMKKYQSFSHGNSLTGSGRNVATSSTGVTAATVKNSSSNRNNNKNRKRKKKKGAHEETFTQALLYVSAYFSCYIFAIVAQFMENVGFPLMLLKAIFYPSQGFWNFLIYVRPRFIEIREKKKDETFWWVLKAVITGGYNLEEERKKKYSSRISMIRRSSSITLLPRGSNNATVEGSGHGRSNRASLDNEIDIEKGSEQLSSMKEEEQENNVNAQSFTKEEENDIEAKCPYNNTPLLLKTSEPTPNSSLFSSDKPSFPLSLNDPSPSQSSQQHLRMNHDNLSSNDFADCRRLSLPLMVSPTGSSTQCSDINSPMVERRHSLPAFPYF